MYMAIKIGLVFLRSHSEWIELLLLFTPNSDFLLFYCSSTYHTTQRVLCEPDWVTTFIYCLHVSRMLYILFWWVNNTHTLTQFLSYEKWQDNTQIFYCYWTHCPKNPWSFFVHQNQIHIPPTHAWNYKRAYYVYIHIYVLLTFYTIVTGD